MSKAKTDLYIEITERIIRALERGTVPWVRPWKDGADLSGPRNGLSGQPYTGVNVLLCYLSGFTSPDWYTWNQIQSFGGTVQKGSKATQLIFYRPIEIEDEDENTGEKEKKIIRIIRHFFVFNREQLTGHIPQPFAPDPTMEEEEAARHIYIEAFAATTGASISHGGNKAYYRPSTDHIQLPPLSQFPDPSAYYSIMLHELVHWTGHEGRLARLAAAGAFGSPEYAHEELVAEIGSAFLCAEFRIQGQLQHEEYIGHWIKRLQNDSRLIFRASRQAREAADYLNRLTGLID